MESADQKGTLSQEFYRERFIRRTMQVLDEKRRRMLDDLCDFAVNLHFLLPPQSENNSTDTGSQTILEEALDRLEDEAFTRLIQEGLQQRKP
jgi:hypothetical protein